MNRKRRGIDLATPNLARVDASPPGQPQRLALQLAMTTAREGLDTARLHARGITNLTAELTQVIDTPELAGPMPERLLPGEGQQT